MHEYILSCFELSEINDIQLLMRGNFLMVAFLFVDIYLLGTSKSLSMGRLMRPFLRDFANGFLYVYITFLALFCIGFHLSVDFNTNPFFQWSFHNTYFYNDFTCFSFVFVSMYV